MSKEMEWPLDAPQPAPPEGQQPVAWMVEWGFKKDRDVIFAGGGSKLTSDKEAADKHVATLRGYEGTDWVRITPLYTRPSDQAVTEAALRRAIIAYRDTPEYDHHLALRNALKAAMEAGG